MDGKIKGESCRCDTGRYHESSWFDASYSAAAVAKNTYTVYDSLIAGEECYECHFNPRLTERTDERSEPICGDITCKDAQR